MHIGIAGNIGSGKTTLTRMLAQHYGWTPKYEAVTHNPFLEDYYKDIPRWSFNLEVYFLTQRFKDVMEIARSRETIIQDRTIFEGVYVFVANNVAMGNLSQRDFDAYMDLFHVMMEMVKLPDLLIVYLCETATENVTVSFEHQAYVWADEAKCRELLPKAIIGDFETNHVFDMLQK